MGLSACAEECVWSEVGEAVFLAGTTPKILTHTLSCAPTHTANPVFGTHAHTHTHTTLTHEQLPCMSYMHM